MEQVRVLPHYHSSYMLIRSCSCCSVCTTRVSRCWCYELPDTLVSFYLYRFRDEHKQLGDSSSNDYDDDDIQQHFAICKLQFRVYCELKPGDQFSFIKCHFRDLQQFLSCSATAYDDYYDNNH